MKTHTLILIFHMILINGTLLKFRVKLYPTDFLLYALFITRRTVHFNFSKFLIFFMSYTYMYILI